MRTKEEIIKQGEDLIYDGFESLKEMGCGEVIPLIEEMKNSKDKLKETIGKISAIGMTLSGMGDLVYTKKMEEAGNSLRKLILLIEMVDRAMAWEKRALLYVGDNLMDPTVKRVVAEFFAEVEPNGGL